MVELRVGLFLGGLDEFFLLDLLVQVLLLEFLILSGAVVVGGILPNHKRNARALLRLLESGVFSKVRLLGPLHPSAQPSDKYYY